VQVSRGTDVGVYVICRDRRDVVVLDLIARSSEPAERAEGITRRRFRELRRDGFLDRIVSTAAGSSQALGLEDRGEALARGVVDELVSGSS